MVWRVRCRGVGRPFVGVVVVDDVVACCRQVPFGRWCGGHGLDWPWSLGMYGDWVGKVGLGEEGAVGRFARATERRQRRVEEIAMAGCF